MTTLPPIRTEPLTLLGASPTNPRKRFPADSIAELAETIAAHGVLQPILVRRTRAVTVGVVVPPFEIVAGERRWRACRLLTEQGRNPHGNAIPVIERDLADAEVLAIQLLENIEREDLHPLEEAEHYQRMREDATAPRTVEQIAEMARISPQRVYDRLQLLHLVDAAREAFLADKLTLKTALQVSRLPAHHQPEAVRHLADWGGEPMGNKAAQKFLRDRFMLRLEHAPFDVADAALVPEASACTACPKRTGANAQLFPDITDADLCTDTTCWAGKKAAQHERLLDQLRTSGYRLLQGEAAREACTGDGRALKPGWVSVEGAVPAALGDSSLKVAEVIERANVPNADVQAIDFPGAGTVLYAVSTQRLEAALKRIKAHRSQLAAAQGKSKPARGDEPAAKAAPKAQGSGAPAPKAGQPAGTPAPQPQEDAQADAEHTELVEQLLDFKLPPSSGGRYAGLTLAEVTRKQEARARAILAAASIARTMLADGSEGLPSGGDLPHMLISALVYFEQLEPCSAIAKLCRTQCEPISNKERDLLAWAGSLTHEEACRVLMAMLALQPVDGGKDDPFALFWRRAAEAVNAPVEHIEERARTAVANRIRVGSLEAGKPAPKAKAPAKKTAARA